MKDLIRFFEFTPEILLLLINAIIIVWVTNHSFKKRKVNGGMELFLLLAGTSIWSVAATFEELARTLEMKIFWSQISYFGVVSVTPFLFLFIYKFCSSGKKIKMLYHILIWIFPVLILIGAFTNEFHHLIWSSVEIIPNGNNFRGIYNHGILFWILAVYSYFFIISCLFFVFRTLYFSHRTLRIQLTLFVLALLFPWLGNFFYITGISTLNIDLTPILFTLSGVFLSLGFLRFNLFNISPIAYGALFKSLSNGVIVLDATKRLINFNASMSKIIGLKDADIGKNLQHIESITSEISIILKNGVAQNTEIELEIDNQISWFNIQSSIISDLNNKEIGVIYIFIDISVKKLSEQALKKSETQFAQINQCLVNLSTDYDTNVNNLVAVCGQLLGANFAFYNCLNNGVLCSSGQWNAPKDYIMTENTEGYVCFEVIRQSMRSSVIIHNLQNTEFYKTDLNVSKFGLQTYAGHPVFANNDNIGSICVVFTENKDFDEQDISVLGIIALALGSEEQRLRDKKALSESEEKYHELSKLFRLTADNMPDMLWAKNLQNEYIFANKALCDNLLIAIDTNEPIGKNDLYFAQRERDAHIDDPEWHSFGEICENSDIITLQHLKPMQFDEFGNVQGKFISLNVHKSPLYNEKGNLIGTVGSARDVTISNAVAAQNKKLSQALEQSPSSVLITNIKGEIEYVNSKFTQITGFTFKEAIGQNPRILKSLGHSVDFYKELWNTIISGKEWKGIFQNKKKNGELYWELASISPLVNEKGVITHFIAIKEDITEEKQVQEDLFLTNETYQIIFNTVSEAIYVMDENANFIDVNRGAEIMYGYTRNELIGKNPEAVAAPGLNDLSAIKNILEDVYRTGLSHTLEFWGEKKSKQVFLKEVIVNKGTYFGKECLIATAREITDRKRNETTQTVLYNIAQFALKATDIKEFADFIRNEANMLFDTSNFFVALDDAKTETLLPVIFIDEKVAYSDWNFGSILMNEIIVTGKSKLLKGIELKKFCISNDIENQCNEVSCLLAVPIYNNNIPFGAIIIQHYSNPKAYDLNDLVILEMLAHEMSIFIEKQRMIEDILAAKDKAEESDRLKSAFLQNMSHEVRTPLNSIIGFSELINSSEIDADIRRFYSDIIIERGWHLTEIINDILTISSLETKQEQLYIEKINVNKLIGDQLVIFEEQANKKGLKLVLKCKLTEDEDNVFVDKTKLIQILSNLYTNAIKFTSEGVIELGCSIKQNMLEFYVRDTGIGIDMSKQNLIFERFVQADDTIRRDYGGTGLGLSICKGFVNLMGGEIWVESVKGSGATFRFNIPYHKAENDIEENKEMINEKAWGTRNLNVLVAEDEEANFLYLSVLLNVFNFNVMRAKDGQQAVDLCFNNEFDFVLMDIKMPIMDGYTAAKIIKERIPSLPIIAQTAHAAQSEIEKFSDAFDYYITKPYTAMKLKLVFDELFKSKEF